MAGPPVWYQAPPKEAVSLEYLNLQWISLKKAWVLLYSTFNNLLFLIFFLFPVHVEDMIKIIYQYITLLRNNGAQKWIFDEVRY